MRLFRRPPRLPPQYPSGEIEIPAPPQPPAAPATSLMTILLPIGGTLVGMGVMMAASSTSGAGSTTMLMMVGSLSLMVSSYLVSIIQYSSTKKKHQQDLAEREKKYRAYLARQEQDLQKLHAEQRSALQQVHPSPEDCLQRAQCMDPHLWERTPQDADFLDLRLGEGRLPFMVALKLPRIDPLQDPDPLMEQAKQLIGRYTLVEGAPVTLGLKSAGIAGLAGPRPMLTEAVRCLAVQLATHHSPDEVKLVAFFPSQEKEAWDWMRWLPHVHNEFGQRYLADTVETAHKLSTALYDLLQERKRKMNDRRDNKPPSLPYFVIFLGDPNLFHNEPVVPLLLTEGPSLGSFSVFLGDRPENLPQGCKAIVSLSAHTNLVQTLSAGQPLAFNPDPLHPWVTDQFARTMAPIQLETLSSAAETPEVVTLLDTLGVSRVEDLDVQGLWQRSEPFKSLAVPVGRRAGGELVKIDLYEKKHGPHGLGAGATRSGKSELLQSYIAALAVHFHPHEVAFVLVDYKGGGTANIFSGLPHVVGIITNLDGNLASRALRALRAELKRREHLIGEANVAPVHIDGYMKKYRQGEVNLPLPRLVIIVDEFAELASELPDFMRELVSVARVGGSLGIHLILTTQNPSGIVSDQIWSNSRLRFCLRMENEETSRDVLRKPDAAYLKRPGQTILQVGNNEIYEQFQASWANAPYHPGGVARRDPNEIFEVGLDGNRSSLRLTPTPTRIDAASTHLQAVVTLIEQVAESAGVKAVPGPWLPPLPNSLSLNSLRAGLGLATSNWGKSCGWMRAIAGLLDDPAHQRQEILTLDLGKESHLAIFGGPTTGKTSFLMTLIASLALDHTPEELHIYLLDFGARILNVFRELPHVGGIVFNDESDRLKRLLKYLQRQIELRRERFAEAGVASLQDYRTQTGQPMPAILLGLDNYAGFINNYGDEDEWLSDIVRDGGKLGIHFIFTTNSPTIMRLRLSNSITLAVAFHLTDRSDYSQAVGALQELEPANLPGRGVLKGKPPMEFQAALPAAGDLDGERMNVLRQLAANLADLWTGQSAPEIPMPPDLLPLDSLVCRADVLVPGEGDPLTIPLGIDFETLEPFCLEMSAGPHFLITGPLNGGKTTLLQSWLLCLANHYPQEKVQLYLVDFAQEGLYPLSTLPQVKGYLSDSVQLDTALVAIMKEVQSRRKAFDQARIAGGSLTRKQFTSRYPALVLAIEDYETIMDQLSPDAKNQLKQLIQREREVGVYVLLIASANVVSTGWEDVIKAMREVPSGILLGSTDTNFTGIFNFSLALEESNKILDSGVGFYTQRGMHRKIKFATAWEGDLSLDAWVEQIKEK